ncbi:MAG: histidine kinase [Clostridia bacterium]|nr:histidine kinase [Clostridia bacterium]
MRKKLYFNVNAYTARLIGRENVSNLEGAILELVKNTYDADASKCILYYEQKNGELYLMDNGFGMTEEVIQKHWMTIGNSSKHTDFVTKKGRTQTGAKGIGRFALDRVSDQCTMYTKNSEEKDIIEWKVNWNDFERAENLTDITAELNYLQNERVYSAIEIDNSNVKELLEQYFKDTGTIFKITNLREEWNHDLIENIRKSLSSLIPPDIENEFSIYLFENNQKQEEALIISQNIDNYDYKIEFQVYENQEVKIELHRNEFELGDDIDNILKRANFLPYEKEYFQGKRIIINKTILELLNMEVENLGEFHGTLYFNKNSTTKEDTKNYFYKDISGRKNYSNIFGGIKLYRDNFRVRPYGEKESNSYDWLGLGVRGHGSPAISDPTRKWRLATDQISGIIHISRTNQYIQDQANREGIVDTKQFRALKEVIIEIIGEFERDRQDVIRRFATISKDRNKVKAKQEEIKNKATEEKKQQENGTQEKIDEYKISASDAQIVIDEKERIIQVLEDENKLLRSLATSGIISNQCIHETKSSIDDVGTDIAASMSRLDDENVDEKAIRFLQDATKHLKILKAWYDVTIGSIRRDKREMKYTNLSNLMNEQIKKWEEVLKREIKITIEIDEEISDVRCFPHEIESIFNNLITNSLYAFKPETIKEINIKINKTIDGIEIIYFDTGKGLAIGYKKNPDRILEALETDKRNVLGEKIGTGMGMWIVNNIVKDYNGEIDLSENKKERIGFYIRIRLKVHKKEE